MRIIAGLYRGRTIKTLKGHELRPTSDRLRETLFNVLGPAVAGSVFIDCYAGSGAVGLEALSRGAAQVFLIEADATANRLIQKNLSSLGGSDKVHLVRASVRTGLRRLEARGVRAHFCFLDPPYAASQEAASNLLWLSTSSVMLPEGLIILERRRKDASPERVGAWSRARLLQQGSSALSFYRQKQILRRCAPQDDSGGDIDHGL